jgi:ubiquinone/menaquinone biosynthesis C-methylase UbiE
MTKLGLPFEYQKMPEFFDAWNVNESTDDKNSVIEKLLREQNTKTILDMTCGTGSQVFHLIKHGYKVTGSDFSPDLLKQARAKAKKEKLNVKFIDGDVRTLKVGHFDAVITMFNAVGHLTKSGFAKAMRNINSNLNPGGIYIFDILNLDAMTDKVVADFAWHVNAKVGNTQMHKVQFSTIDRKNGLLTSYDHAIIQKSVEKPILSKSNFTLQIYIAMELQEMLAKSGFEVLGQYDIDGKKFVQNKSISVITVARKISP